MLDKPERKLNMLVKFPVIRLKSVEFKLPTLKRTLKVPAVAGSTLEVEHQLAQLKELLVQEVSRLDSEIKASSSSQVMPEDDSQESCACRGATLRDELDTVRQGLVHLAQTVIELDDRLSKLES